MSSKCSETRGHQELAKLLEKYTQNELSELTGVGQSAISQIKNFERMPSLDGALGFEKVGIVPAWWKEPPLHGSGEHLQVNVSKDEAV